MSSPIRILQLELIDSSKHPDCLIYADPPYVLSTRTQGLSADEMSETEHLALLDALDKHPGPVVLSASVHPLYESRLLHWHRITTPAVAEHGRERTEVLWLNRKVTPCQQLRLFEQRTRYRVTEANEKPSSLREDGFLFAFFAFAGAQRLRLGITLLLFLEKTLRISPARPKKACSRKGGDFHAKVTVQQVQENAMRWHLIARNVCEGVSLPRQTRREIQPLTKAQAHALLQAAKGHRLEALLIVALTTGMRRGELLALRWQDINFEERSLRIRRTVNRLAGYGYVETEPKTTKSRGKIVLPAFVIEALKQHRARQIEMRQQAGSARGE